MDNKSDRAGSVVLTALCIAAVVICSFLGISNLSQRKAQSEAENTKPSITANFTQIETDFEETLTKAFQSDPTAANAQSEISSEEETSNQTTGALSDEESSKTVYVTATGTKYHRKECSYLKKSSSPITKANAIRDGYGPCSRCKP